MLGAIGAEAQQIDFDPSITQAQFDRFTLTVSSALYASPVEPADGGGLLGFDIGLAVSAIEVDETAAYWINSVSEDFLEQGYLPVPRLVVSKGFNRFKIHGSYAQVPDTDIDVIGAGLDITLLREGLIAPAIGARGIWTELRGVEDYELEITGLEAVASKKIGPLTPWIAWGRMEMDALGQISIDPMLMGLQLASNQKEDRLSVGARFSLLLFQISAEATEIADDRVYSVKLNLSL